MNSVNVDFEVSFYKKTCEVDVSEAVIDYKKVSPIDIVKNDSGETTKLNRDITLKLARCSNVSDLSKSKIFVSGQTEIFNGKPLFKESGTSKGVGIKLLVDDIAKTDGDVLFQLNSSNAIGDTFTVTTALSCGECSNTSQIAKGSFKASMIFTVFTD
ncbi:fimbrial protein [Providencia stuartii]|uniref:Fimbrial protein n=2 Tax=Morganellaceae TaxID=1903414 RepID=A0ABD5L4L3_PROST|nr:fimbrial protein [Providencia stuartii]ELR5045540.1 fimbrial protein [Providencia rettgeri]ELR5291015.1 fimbrial protein [Providencia stuartii]